MAGASTTFKLALALLAVGALFDLPQLYVPGIALALLTVGCFAWVEAAARAIRLDSLAGPPTVVEGEPYAFRIRIEVGRPPPPGGELSHSALAEPIAIGPRAPGLISAEARFERWGRRQVEAPLLCVHDPLSLHRRQVDGGAGWQLLVLPRVEPVVAPRSGNGGSPVLAGGENGEGAGGRVSHAIDPEVDGVRPWRPGTPASRIHWPSVARTGELLERGVVGGAESSPLVVLDRSHRADEESLLSAVRAAASLCVHLARAGGCSLLLPGESRPLAIDRELRTWPRAHARLALVDPERHGPVHLPPHAGATLWVTPAGQPDARAVRQRGQGVTYLVTPAAVPGVHPAFEVAGCRGYPLEAIRRAPAAARVGSR
jgi:uncharacterized protein (DUF58 family)